MNKLLKSFLKDNHQWIISLYLFALFVIFPLYIRDGYYDIGYAKFAFLKISTGIGLILIFISFLIQLFTKHLPPQVTVFTPTDICVVVYMFANTISLAFSIDTKVSIWGQRGWYMGALAAIAFAYMYFAITKLYDGNRILLPMILGGSSAVFLLGILNRFGIWPIPIEIEFQYSFISTIGNIGWYSSYIAVIAPIGVTLLINRRAYRIYQQVLLAVYTYIVFVTSFSQGTDSLFIFFAILLLGTMFVASFYECGFKHWLEIVILWCLAGQTVHIIRYIWPQSYGYETDNICGTWNNSFYTLWILIPVLIIYFLVYKKSIMNKWLTHAMRAIPSIILALGAIWFVIAVIYSHMLGMDVQHEVTGLGRMFYLDQYWGDGRGAAFDIGLNIWLEQGLGRRLIGIGPDCFVQYISSSTHLSSIAYDAFGGAILANAHNEFITNLVNIGAVGTVAFYGIFVSYAYTGLKLIKKDIKIAAVAIGMLCYIGYNIVNYAELVNYPFYIILVALGEMYRRIGAKEKERGHEN